MSSCRHAGVASRRVELFVSEQRLNQPNVLAVLEQMGCEGMTQRMKRDRLAQPRRLRRLLEQPAELARSRRVTINATGKQPTLFRRNAGVAPGRPRLPPSPQQVEDLGRKHHITVLAFFRLTMRMIICSLSMSQARSRTTSLARSPQPYASVSIARALRLVAIVRTRLTSSGLNTGGSVCGSLRCQISAARSW